MVIAAPGDPVGGSAAQRAAQAELRHSEYHHSGPNPVTRALDWVGRHLDSLLSGGGGGSHALLVFLIIVLAVGIAIAVRAGVPTRRRTGQRTAQTDPLAPIAARDHRRLAAQYEAQGRRAEALREWLRATVQTIEERGVLPPRPGRTGAATAREAGPVLPAAAADLARATAAFDEVWFGARPATDADVTSARSAADAVRAARITGATGAPPADGIAVPW